MRPIPGWSRYFADEDGNIYSVRRRTYCKLLNPAPNSMGRLVVTLYKNGPRKTVLVHRLILETFVGPCPPGMEACHNDGDPLNNRLDNLRWDTHTANFADAIRHGTSNQGERHGMAKLTADQVRAIRKESGTQREIAKKYGVSQRAIYGIKSRRDWAWLED